MIGGMDWSQLRTVIWLRWRLTRNQVSRLGTLNAVVAIIGLIAGICLAAGMGVAGVFIGAVVFSKAEPLVIMLAWDGIVGLFLFVDDFRAGRKFSGQKRWYLARLLHACHIARSFLSLITSRPTFRSDSSSLFRSRSGFA